jgi:hypothetical protein
MNIKIVRLNSGEEILCNLSRAEPDSILKDPLLIVPTQGGQIGFMSWMPYADVKDGVSIPNSFIVFAVKPDEMLVKEYTSHVSGIVVPSSEPVVSGPIGIVK